MLLKGPAILLGAVVLRLDRSSAFLSRNNSPFRDQRPAVLQMTTPLLLDVDTGDEGKPFHAESKRVSLRWVIQAIERYDDPKSPPPNPKLVEALRLLDEARTQKQVLEAGRMLESIPIKETESLYVQERLIKATAITGLMSLSLDILDGLLSRDIVPSSVAYTALCRALRQARRVNQLEELILRLGKRTNIHVIALNVFLAALCDVITKQETSKKQQRKLDLQEIGQLEKARKWLSPGYAYKNARVKPDESSYATVIHAAASAGNRAMVRELWNEMKQQGISPNRYACNALIRAISKEGPEFDEELLDLLDQMRRNPFLQPDQYTVDLALIPVMRATGGFSAVWTLIEDFCKNHGSQTIVMEQAFSSFLITLVNADEIEAAQNLFDRFLLAQRHGKKNVLDHGVIPSVRHYNILLNGLKRSLAKIKSQSDKEETRRHAATLYRSMIREGVRPDEFTLTILMGLVKDNQEVTRLLRTAVIDRGVDMTAVVFRSSLSAFGETNDASSACWLFEVFREQFNDVKTWNALIGALVACAAIDGAARLHIQSSQASEDLSPDFAIAGMQEEPKVICSLLNGKTCPEGALLILQLMNKHICTPLEAPLPNSQTYCLVASAAQHGESNVALPLELFRNATSLHIPADGRFVNALIRCFRADINAALKAWKEDIRSPCLAAEKRAPSSSARSTDKNLLSAYHSLLFVAGRAFRPDIALRLVYAMNKEGVEVNEMAMQCYHAGKRKGITDSDNENVQRDAIAFCKQFENVLSVECTKYDTRDKRREGDKRVRIIL
jgi:pentatricopeptide repeat protein